MKTSKDITIRSRARNLLLAMWRCQRPSHKPGQIPLNFLLRAPSEIARTYFKCDVYEIPHILHSSSNTRLAGILNRDEKAIIVAREFGYEQSRFTLAHEIGHCDLHPGVILHHEKPMSWTANAYRTPIERQADLFAAELLMPSQMVKEQFIMRFRAPYSTTYQTDGRDYWFNLHDNTFDSGKWLQDENYRSLQFATTQYCLGAHFQSLSDAFRVSPQAMGIQLRQLGLVR